MPPEEPHSNRRGRGRRERSGEPTIAGGEPPTLPAETTKKAAHGEVRRQGAGEAYFLAFFSLGGSQATMRHMEDSISMPRSGKQPM